MLLVLCLLSITLCGAVENATCNLQELNLNDLKKAFNRQYYLDKLDCNVTVAILNKDASRLNVSLQYLVDNCRDLLNLTTQVPHEYEEIPQITIFLAYFNKSITSTQELLDYAHSHAPHLYDSIRWRKDMIEDKMRRFLGKEATKFVQWVAREFAEMSYNHVADWYTNCDRKIEHGNLVLARLESLSGDAQNQIKASFPFYTIQKLQHIDPVKINELLGGFMKAENTYPDWGRGDGTDSEWEWMVEEPEWELTP